MPDIHYLPAQYVERQYPERLTVRGEDVALLMDILAAAEHAVSLSTEEHDFIDRIFKVREV